ncbi:MAG: hypothetical protein JWQ04_2786 [Pedosphaera sp.]|nr:hypothetical protein [Pedosphaera sp.]
MITCTIDTNRLYLMMDAIRDALISKGGDASNLVQKQTRLLARTIVNFIPPIRAQGQKGSAQLNGEDSAKKDLCSLFSEAKPQTMDEIGSLHGVKNIDTWVTGPAGKTHLLWDHLDPNAAHMPEEHNLYRGRYGTVKRLRPPGAGTWKARVVIPQGSRAPYIKAVQGRVGIAKCTIALAGMRLGDTGYPAWIHRHVDEVLQGKAILHINLENPAAPAITFGSRAPGITRFGQRVQDAVSFRARVMGRELKLILNDYKGWQTVQAKSRARKNKFTETPEVVE